MRGILATALLVATISASIPAAAQELPTIPDPVPVTVERGTTALLVMDFSNPPCSFFPGACDRAVPVASDLLMRARAADMFVVHTTTTIPGAAVLAEVAPLSSEASVAALADKFLDTSLDDLLRGRGIKTLILVGFASEGAVLYTGSEAIFRGYTVVVADDGVSSITPFGALFVRYQLLNLPGRDNAQNEPLRAGRVTLSRSDLITIQ